MQQSAASKPPAAWLGHTGNAAHLLSLLLLQPPLLPLPPLLLLLTSTLWLLQLPSLVTAGPVCSSCSSLALLLLSSGRIPATALSARLAAATGSSCSPSCQ